jgi:hypothetical protein
VSLGMGRLPLNLQQSLWKSSLSQPWGFTLVSHLQLNFEVVGAAMCKLVKQDSVFQAYKL